MDWKALKTIPSGATVPADYSINPKLCVYTMGTFFQDVIRYIFCQPVSFQKVFSNIFIEDFNNFIAPSGATLLF